MTILADGWKKRTGSNLSCVAGVSLNCRLSEINFEGNVADRRIGAKPVPDGWVMVRISRKGRMCEEAVDNLESAARHVGFVQDVFETESWIAGLPSCILHVDSVRRQSDMGWRGLERYSR